MNLQQIVLQLSIEIARIGSQRDAAEGEVVRLSAELEALKNKQSTLTEENENL